MNALFASYAFRELTFTSSSYSRPSFRASSMTLSWSRSEAAHAEASSVHSTWKSGMFSRRTRKRSIASPDCSSRYASATSSAPSGSCLYEIVQSRIIENCSWHAAYRITYFRFSVSTVYSRSPNRSACSLTAFSRRLNMFVPRTMNTGMPVASTAIRA